MERPTSSLPKATAPLLRPGAVIGGKYRLEQELGRGGMGVVVAARNLQTGGEVALKFIRGEGLTTAHQAERMMREARAAARLQDEHVARILDVGALHDGSPFLVLERLRGHDLSAELLESGPQPIERAVDWVLQITEALAEAHAMGIVHRDLKPSNLFVTHRPDGSARLKLLDFGISRLPVVDQQQPLTGEALLGTPPYIAPEQIRDPHGVDARADLWSLGVVLFEMLTGHRPFVASLPAGLLAAVIADEPRSLSELLPGAPLGLTQAVERCLTKDPARRFGSALELALALEPFGSAEGKAACRRLVGSPPSPPVDAAPEPLATLDSLDTSASDERAAPSPPTLSSDSLPVEHDASWSAGPPAAIDVSSQGGATRPRRTMLSAFAAALLGGGFLLWAALARGPASAEAPRSTTPTVSAPAPALSPLLATPVIPQPPPASLSAPSSSAASAMVPAALQAPSSRPPARGPKKLGRARDDEQDRSW